MKSEMLKILLKSKEFQKNCKISCTFAEKKRQRTNRTKKVNLTRRFI